MQQNLRQTWIRNPQDFDLVSLQGLQTLKLHLGVEDTWRIHNPGIVATTHQLGSNVETRIDRVYISSSATQISKILHEPFTHSDDFNAVLVRIDQRLSTYGTGFWHFNNTLVEDQLYCASFKRWWDLWRQRRNSYSNLAEWWDKGNNL